MKKEWNDVREFHDKFGHPVAEEPKMIDKKRALSRAKWMQEEVSEFLVAEDIYEQADAMIDLMYFALGTMVEMGLEQEARDVYHLRHLNSLQTVGYREMFDYFDGTVSREEAIDLIKRNSRRYAKRQLTWFGRDDEIKWFLPSETEKIVEYIDSKVCTLK